jgi:CMP-N-acetylneuraminic acid synthetase
MTESSAPRIVALVPMRHESERVPGKNYRPMQGQPLYRHIVAALQGCPDIAQIVIDTDSPTVKEDAAKAFPGVTVLDRPEHLRDGNIPMNDVLLNDVRQVPADLYLQTHSTNPLLRPSTISGRSASSASTPSTTPWSRSRGSRPGCGRPRASR